MDEILVEVAIFSFQIQGVFMEPLQDLRNVLAMFGLALGENKDIIYVDYPTPLQEVQEHLIHEILEYGDGVDRALWHYKIFIMSPSYIRMRLNTLRMSNLVNMEAPQSCFSSSGMRELDGDLV